MDLFFSKITSSLFDFFFLCIALVVLAFFAIRLLQAWRGMAHCRTWLEAPGRILSSGIVRRRKIGHKTSSFPNILYQYEVNGKTYQADRLHPPPETGGAWWAARKVAQYPTGKSVLVSYNPENPFEAVLEKQGPVGLYLWIFFALIFFFLWNFVWRF